MNVNYNLTDVWKPTTTIILLCLNAHWCACVPSPPKKQGSADYHLECVHYQAPACGQKLNIKKVLKQWHLKAQQKDYTDCFFSGSHLTSMWSAFARGGGHFWPLTQLIRQCSPVYLQCSGSAPCPDQMEASSVRQQGLILCQPVPRLLLPQ